MDDIQAVIDFGAKYNVSLDEQDARLLIANREALTRDPTDPEALRISRHLEALLWWACKVDEDDYFGHLVSEPQCPDGCPECAARLARQAQKF
jgi:hypothetical protein